jgi:hypothetical protein
LNHDEFEALQTRSAWYAPNATTEQHRQAAGAEVLTAVEAIEWAAAVLSQEDVAAALDEVLCRRLGAAAAQLSTYMVQPPLQPQPVAPLQKQWEEEEEERQLQQRGAAVLPEAAVDDPHHRHVAQVDEETPDLEPYKAAHAARVKAMRASAASMRASAAHPAEPSEMQPSPQKQRKKQKTEIARESVRHHPFRETRGAERALAQPPAPVHHPPPPLRSTTSDEEMASASSDGLGCLRFYAAQREPQSTDIDDLEGEAPPTGKALVNRRIRLWWGGDGRWYDGVVGAMRDRKYRVQYIDGDVRWHMLDDPVAERWMLLR